MKKVLDEKRLKLQDPQESLELILTAEIEIANKVSEARERADKSILEAQNNLGNLKARMIEDARAERDTLFQEGVMATNQEAEKRIAAARSEAQVFLESGQKFLAEAGEHVLALLLGQEGDAR